MEEVLTTIKEVQEGGKRFANYYLEHGYILLGVQQGARVQKFPEDGQNGRQYYVRRNPVYVLGRPEGVESVGPPPFVTPREKPEDNDSHGQG